MEPDESGLAVVSLEMETAPMSKSNLQCDNPVMQHCCLHGVDIVTRKITKAFPDDRTPSNNRMNLQHIISTVLGRWL